jgi:hypothetical protein
MRMSDTTDIIAERDRTTGRFVSGNSGGPGRKVGSRNRFSEAYIQDLHACWEKHGPDVLERVARDEPGTLLKVAAMLMPKDIAVNLAVSVDPTEFVGRFRHAVELLGNDPAHARPMKVIGARKR